MKKKLFALSGVFLIVLVVTGLWATRATDLMDSVQQNQIRSDVAGSWGVNGGDGGRLVVDRHGQMPWDQKPVDRGPPPGYAGDGLGHGDDQGRRRLNALTVICPAASTAIGSFPSP